MTVVQNKSSRDGRKVKSIVIWTLRELDADVDDLLVRVRDTDSHTHHGCCFWYPDGPLPAGINHLVTAAVPLREIPALHQRKIRGGPPPLLILRWEESLVAIIAHEGTHVRQHLSEGNGDGGFYRNQWFPTLKKHKRVYVKPRHFSEVDAEWAETRLVIRWQGRRKR